MFKINCRMSLWFIAAALAFGVMVVQLRRSDADGPAGGAAAQAGEKPKRAAHDKSAETPPVSYSLGDDENERRIREALKKITRFDFQETPLREAIEHIGKEHNLPVWIDEKALVDAVIATDTPVTRKVQNVSLESALRLMLRPLQMTFRIDQDVLQITTQPEADQQLVIRIYPIGDLLTALDRPNERNESHQENLIDVITTTVTPTAWDEVGGPCSMETYRDSLIVSATEETHEQIVELMAGLRKLRQSQRQQLGGQAVDIGEAKALEAAEKALARAVDWDFNEMPLADAVKYIAKQTSVEIQLDDRGMADAAIALDTPVTFRLSGVRMRNALRLMLHPLQLTYVVRDEVVLITTQAEADQSLRTRLYPVGDLLACGREEPLNASDRRCEFDALIDVVQSTVSPNSWDEVGGPGGILPYDAGLALAVSQTEEAHSQTDALLVRLRDVSKSEPAPISNKLLLKVYALSQSRPQAPSKDATSRADVAGQGQELPPPGVPATEAAGVIRDLVAPASWNEPDVILRALPSHLVIKQTKSAHRQIEELLKQLGPWHEVPARAAVPFGGTFDGFSPASFQVADDPVRPRERQTAETNPFKAPSTGPANRDPSGPQGTGAAGGDPFGPPPGASQTRDRQAGDPRAESRDRPDPERERPDDREGRSADRRGRSDRPQTTGFGVYGQSPQERRIRDELDNQTDLEFNEVPLRDAIDFLKDKHGIEIQLDQRLLSEASVTTDTPVTIHVKGVMLRSALRLLLGQLPNSPTFVVSNQVLLITTREGAAQRKLVRVYDVDGLVEAPSATVNDFVPEPAPPRGGYGVPARMSIQQMPLDRAVALASLIQQTIEPDTWTRDHGCSVVPFVSKDSTLLVVRQSAGVHDEIIDLFELIQQAQREPRRDR